MSKTPKTILENYFDAAKTQTGILRTPEMHSSQKQNFGKQVTSRSLHEMSSHRSQEQYIGVNRRVSRTPEPYMHSGAKSRPQHDRVSSLRSKRRSFSNKEGEETPRQLLQGFLESEDTTAPLVRYASRTSQGKLSSSQPALPISDRRYSLSRPGNWTVDMDYDTPRTLLQGYVLNTTAAIETPAPRRGIPQQHTPDLPVQQDTFHTPSPFKTSNDGSEGTEELVTLGRTRRRTPRSARRGNFSINVLDSVHDPEDESVIPPTNPNQYQVPSPFCSSSSDEDSVVAETVLSSTHSRKSQHHRGHFNISLPDAIKEEIRQKQYREGIGETRNQAGNFEDERGSEIESEQDFEVAQETSTLQQGTNLLPDWKEYTLPLKDSSMDRSLVISDKGYHRLSSVDGAQKSPVPSPHHFSREEQMIEQMFEDGISTAEVRRREDSTKRSEIIERMSSRHIDQVVDAHSPARLHSYIKDFDELYSAQKLEYSQTDKSLNQSVQNIFGNFSPKVTSTQKPIDTSRVLTPSHKENLSTSVSPASSVRSVSSRKSGSRVLTPSQTGTPSDRSRNITQGSSGRRSTTPLQTVTPSPVVSSRGSEMSESPSSLALKPSSRISRTPSHTPEGSKTERSRLMQSIEVTSPVVAGRRLSTVSPASSVGSVSPRKSGSRVLSPSQMGTPSDRSRNITKGSSGRRSTNPMQTVTPSHVVSSRGSETGESQSSLALKPSSRISRTPSQTPEQGSKTERSRLMQSIEVTSPVVAGRRLNTDMVNTLPNNTANFSPQVASTQNMAKLARVGPTATEQLPGEGTDTPIDNEPWQDEMDTDDGESNRQRSRAQASVTKSSESVKKPKKVTRKPRQKSNYSLPVNVVKKQFTHFAGLRVSKEAIEEVMKVSEKYWDSLARDLEAYAKHAGRKQINMSDFVLLFKRQGYVTEKQSLKSLIEKYLPMEEREKLIPVARAGNRIEPKL